jgi:Restriction endonuclease BamHI
VAAVKLNNTFLLVDRGKASETADWAASHAAIASAILGMAWPVESIDGLVIPRIVSVKPGENYTNERGKVVTWKDGKSKKKKTLRNGVKPLRQMFRAKLEKVTGWRAEEPLSLKEYFELVRADTQLEQISRYPAAPPETVHDPLHEGVGDFDFWLSSDTGFRTVVEWETGNISSSHRSLNKMCLALMGGLTDAGVLVVPSFYLYPHLTDRIGNIRELQPYFYFWRNVGHLIDKGLLAVMEVEQDGLIKSTDMRDFIPTGDDGNAFRVASRKTKTPPVRKRAKRTP